MRIFLSSGGSLWKGKVLEPFSSAVIYWLLISWSLWNALCLCKFENILKTPKFGKLYNDSRIIENVYKVLALKIFCLKMSFWKSQCEAILQWFSYHWECIQKCLFWQIFGKCEVQMVLFVRNQLRAIYLLKKSLFISSSFR